jgi:hypothetical protein
MLRDARSTCITNKVSLNFVDIHIVVEMKYFAESLVQNRNYGNGKQKPASLGILVVYIQ